MKALNICLAFLFFSLARVSLLPIDVSLTVTNSQDSTKTAEPITSGIPFAQGVLTDISRVRLLQNNNEIPAQFRTLATWPDNSIRWLLVDFQADLPASSSIPLTLRTGSAPAAVTGITYTHTSSTLTVQTGPTTFTFNKNQLALAGKFFQVTSGTTTYTAVPANGNWSIEESGPLKLVVKAEGNWFNGSTRLANALVGFRARLFFYKNKNYIRVLFTFRNNNSFGWYSAQGPAVTLSHVSLETSLLPPLGHYVFGQGVEKTWEIFVPAQGTPVKRDFRFTSSGEVAPGYDSLPPLAVATPAYYASTRAWGPISLPLTGFSTDLQADFDLYEKFHRAKVIQSDVEDPPGKPGLSLWGHLYQDINSWNDYGDLRWGGGCGPFSGNHYDWIYGMLLHFMRTGHNQFLDAARVFARHEIDFDIYHTSADGEAYNYHKNWESRPSHESPDNCFGGGRPSHTWLGGYALYWLMTGDPRGKDAVDELAEGIRQYVYESFNYGGYIDTNEIRIQGWLTENLVALWRINPNQTFSTSQNGTKTIPNMIKDILKSVFDLETDAGNHGYILADNPPNPNLSQPLMNCYFIEPAIHAYEEVFKGRDNSYASSLLALIRRMTSWLMSVTYGGDTNATGLYRPRQIPYMVDRSLPTQTEGQVPYILMALNAASFCYTETQQAAYRHYAGPAFQDYIRYLGVEPGDTYLDPSERTPTSFNSSVYVDTEPKVLGWSNRYGQYYLAMEAQSVTATLTLTAPNGGQVIAVASVYPITWTSTGSISNIKIQFSPDNGNSWSTIIASTPNTGQYNWTVPHVTSTNCRIKIISTSASSVYDISNSSFTISTGGIAVIQLDHEHFYFASVQQQVTSSQYLYISNSGSGILDWTATPSHSWIQVSPGSQSGNASIQVDMDASSLVPGTYNGHITLSAPGAANSPQVLLVTLIISTKNNPPFGVFEYPIDQSTAMSSIPVTGWALDDTEVVEVKIMIEPLPGEGSEWLQIGTATLVDHARPDIEQSFPGFPKNYRGGWGYMLLSYGLPGKGMNHTYRIHAIAYDQHGWGTDLGVKTITCANAQAVKPFGAIDTPAQGGIANGTHYANQGWVLTPPPNSIPTNGSTIVVWIDGVAVGHPVYNIYRPDIATLFPGYINANAAAALFYFDTTAYTNGVHTIAWTVTDSAGNTDGIGSRFFTIQNISPRASIPNNPSHFNKKSFLGVQGAIFQKSPLVAAILSYWFP